MTEPKREHARAGARLAPAARPARRAARFAGGPWRIWRFPRLHRRRRRRHRGRRLGFAVAEGRPRAGGARDPRRRPLVRSRPARGERGRAWLSFGAGAPLGRHADARHGPARRWRRGDRRHQGGRRPLSARRRGGSRSAPAARRCACRTGRRLWRCGRSGLFAAARPFRRRFLFDRRGALSRGRASDP